MSSRILAAFIQVFYLAILIPFCRFPFVFSIFFSLQLILMLALWLHSSSILAFFIGCRKELTREERERAYEAFREVVKAHTLEERIYTRYRDNIKYKLLIDNSLNVNAYALGNDSVVLTRGALFQMTEDELKGLIAHELAHLFHGDAVLNLIINFGSIFSIPLMLMQRNTRYYIRRQSRFVYALLSIITFFGRCIESSISRSNELNADFYARLYLEYGEELRDALIKLSMTKARNQSLGERLTSSHPDIFLRIVYLEKALHL